MKRRLAFPTLFAAAAAATACASSGTAGSGACSSDLLTSRQPLSGVLDSVAVQSRLSTAWPASAGLTLARIGGSADNPVAIWSGSASDAEKDALRDALAASTLAPADQTERAYFVLGDDAGPSVRRVDRFAQCAPRIFGREGLESRIAAESRGLGLQDRVVVYLQVFVEETGAVGEVRVGQSSGDFRVDQAAARSFDGVNFTPARLEGIPVAVWVRFPVTFTPS